MDPQSKQEQELQLHRHHLTGKQLKSSDCETDGLMEGYCTLVLMLQI